MIYGFTVLEILLMGSAVGVFLLVLVLIVLTQQSSSEDKPAQGFDESLDDLPQKPSTSPRAMDMRAPEKPTTPKEEMSAPSTEEVEPITELLDQEEPESPKKLEVKEEVTEKETIVKVAEEAPEETPEQTEEPQEEKPVHVAVAGEDLPDEEEVVPGQQLPVNKGLVLWLDVFDPATLFQDSKGVVPITRDGQTLGRIADKSSSENHAAQLDADKQPEYKEAIANGKPGLVFEEDYLEGLQGFGAGKTFTVFFVGQNQTKEDAWPGVFTTKPSGSHDESGKQGFAVFGEKDSYGFKFEMGDVYLNDSNGEESHLSLVVGSDSDNNDSNKYVVGDWVSLDQPFKGIVSEIVVFDRDLSDEERSLIITYLQTKWFVTE
jgi:outer membrane biosynthesis protein TonB